MAKRLYELNYDGGGPAYIEDIGSTLKLSGVLYQGQGANLLLLNVTANDVKDLQIERPSLDQWCAIIKQSDDPVFFENRPEMKAVVRKQQRAIAGGVQQKIWARDEFTCMFCGKKMGDVMLTVDHWVPLELGGSDSEDNLLSACRRCNKAKGHLAPEEFCAKHGYDHEGIEAYLQGKLPRYFIAHLGG